MGPVFGDFKTSLTLKLGRGQAKLPYSLKSKKSKKSTKSTSCGLFPDSLILWISLKDEWTQRECDLLIFGLSIKRGLVEKIHARRTSHSTILHIRKGKGNSHSWRHKATKKNTRWNWSTIWRRTLFTAHKVIKLHRSLFIRILFMRIARLKIGQNLRLS